jgi:hypothetical protein
MGRWAGTGSVLPSARTKTQRLSTHSLRETLVSRRRFRPACVLRSVSAVRDHDNKAETLIGDDRQPTACMRASPSGRAPVRKSGKAVGMIVTGAGAIPGEAECEEFLPAIEVRAGTRLGAVNDDNRQIAIVHATTSGRWSVLKSDDTGDTEEHDNDVPTQFESNTPRGNAGDPPGKRGAGPPSRP